MSDQLRGIKISPMGQPNGTAINYYTILLDVPANVTASQFTAGKANGTTIEYTYNNNEANPLTGDGVVLTSTIALTIFTSQANAVDYTAVKVLDTAKTVLLTGNPNKTPPPIIDYMEPSNILEGSTVNPGVPSVLILQSELQVGNDRPFYFIVTMVNTGQQSDLGYKNLITQIVPQTEDKTLWFVLHPDADLANETRAAIGIYPSALYEWNYVMIRYGTLDEHNLFEGSTAPINYSRLL